MVPLHETDLAEERWSKVEWENYELWEKVELRLKRQRRLWILFTLLLFLVFSSIPIVMDRWPKWRTRAIARKLAQELNNLKREAGTRHAAHRLRFISEEKLDFIVEKVDSCDSKSAEFAWSGSLRDEKDSENQYYWLSPEKGQSLGIPGLMKQFCYDPLVGYELGKNEGEFTGFGFIAAKDLTENRQDRISILLLSGQSAEISFD